MDNAHHYVYRESRCQRLNYIVVSAIDGANPLMLPKVYTGKEITIARDQIPKAEMI